MGARRLVHERRSAMETPEDEGSPVERERAVICDIDGTLADLGRRHPFDYDNVDQDVVKHAVAELLRILHAAGVKILLVSGREDTARRKTLGWLAANNIPFDELAMRKAGDYRKDTIVKREIYQHRIRGRFDVLFVLDDRDQVVEMWRVTLKLPCFQVDYGNF
jgi:phosphoglycolate phosphatase-like HAD superfamily hydrolase